MTREEILKNIHTAFDHEAKDFSQKYGGQGCSFKTKYKKQESIEDLKYRIARITFSDFILEFKYTAHTFMSASHSILEGLIYFESSEDALGVPFQFLASFYGIKTKTPLSVPYISNKEGMKEAFDILSDFFEEIKPKLENTKRNFKEKEIIDYFEKELRVSFSIPSNTDTETRSVFEEYPYEVIYSMITLRYSSPAYINILNNNNQKAKKFLEKQKNKNSYELSLLETLKNEEVEITKLQSIRANTVFLNDSGIQKFSFRDLLLLMFSWLMLSAVISPLFFLVYFVFLKLESRGSIFLTGIYSDFYCCILAAFIVGICISYYTRKWFYKLFHRKKLKAHLEMDALVNGKGSDKTIKVFTFICFALSIAFIFLIVKYNLNFTETGFVDNTKFFSIKGTFYEYEQIDYVYYSPQRENDFGEKLDLPYYVIVLKNGKEIDTFEFEDTIRIEKELVPILEEKNVTIKK